MLFIMWSSVWFTISAIPGIIISPSTGSNQCNRCRRMSGSKNAVKRQPVAIQTKVILAFEALIDPKKVSQCRATSIPIPRKIKIYFRGIFFKRRCTPKKIHKLRLVSKTRHQTRWMVCMSIMTPRIAVKPNRKTARWSSKYAFFKMNTPFEGVKIVQLRLVQC